MTAALRPINGQHAIQGLSDRIILHSLTRTVQPVLPEVPDTDTSLTCHSDSLIYSPVTGRYSSDYFHGIVIDTGAAFTSTAGYGQFLALQETQDVEIN
jgi:hypothetical protein